MSSVGYKNPPKETQFGAGESGNPQGKTSEQRKAEIEAAEKAALIQKAMLDALSEHIEGNPEAALEAIKSDPLKLIKDAMDRGLGTAVQKVASTTPEGEALTVNPDKLTLAQRKALLDAMVEDEPDANAG